MENGDKLYSNNNWDKALNIYKTLNTYIGYYKAGLCCIKLEKDDDAIIYMLKAYNLNSSYLEPIGDLIIYFNSKQKYDLTILISDIIKSYKLPNEHIYEINKDYYSYKLQYEIGIAYYKLDKHLLSFNIMEFLLDKTLPPKVKLLCESHQSLCVKQVKEFYEIYPSYRIKKIMRNTLHTNIVLTITSCKRLDLFKKTINSFINCCDDYYLIDKWICIDDNSSEEDKKEMQRLYPFFKFIWKTPTEKGHIMSLNKLINFFNYDKNKYIDYTIHLEDDWTFVKCKKYITEALHILEIDNKYGQVLFNRNYTQDINDQIDGGIEKRTYSDLPYIEHVYIPSNTIKYINYTKDLYANNTYWPHYSLRPSVTRVKIFRELGHFDCFYGHFENIYGLNYVKNGYKSVFMKGIYCIHTGPKSGDNSNIPNSYILNNEKQFNWTAPDPPPLKNFKFIPGKDIVSDKSINVENPTLNQLKKASKNYKIKILSTNGKFSTIPNKYSVVIYDPNPNFPYKTGIWIRESLHKETFYSKFLTGNNSMSVIDSAIQECFDKKFYGASLRFCKMIINNAEILEVKPLKNRETILVHLKKSNLYSECNIYTQIKNLLGIAHDLLSSDFDAFIFNSKSKNLDLFKSEYIRYNDNNPDWEVLILNFGTIINRLGAVKIILHNITSKESPMFYKLKIYK